MKPRVSIIILTKNPGSQFGEILSAIERQSYSGPVETVVVDSGSTDGTLSRAEANGCAIYTIDPEDFHHSKTRNFGAENASGDILVYLTHDATPKTEDWLENLVNPIITDQAGVVYGRQVAYPDAKPMNEFFYSHFYPDQRNTLTADDATDTRQFFLDNVYVSDVSAAIERDIWERYRFQEAINMSEDKDFALRVLDEGVNIVYEPEAVVYHSHDYDLRENLKRRFEDGRAYATIAANGEDNFVSNGVQYVIKEMRYLVKNGYIHWLPYVVLYDFTHFFGFQCGKLLGQIEDLER